MDSKSIKNMRQIGSPNMERYVKPKTTQPGKRAEMYSTRNDLPRSEFEQLDTKNNITDQKVNVKSISEDSYIEIIPNLPVNLDRGLMISKTKKSSINIRKISSRYSSSSIYN
jgi:hypothetical protein